MRPYIVGIFCSIVASSTLSAQDTTPEALSRHAHLPTLSLVAGASQWDLAGTGTAAALGIRADVELNRWFLGELGAGMMRPVEQYSPRAAFIFPEFQMQAQIPFRVVRPYVGIGAGFETVFATGYGSASTQTANVAAGLRALIPRTSTTLRAELRIRGVGPRYTGAMADWTLGLGHRF